MSLLYETKKLIKAAKEDDANVDEMLALESLIRGLLADEQTAISHYYKAADICKNNKMHSLKRLFKDLALEEVVHVGELQKALKNFDIYHVPQIADGEKEAGDKLKQ